MSSMQPGLLWFNSIFMCIEVQMAEDKTLIPLVKMGVEVQCFDRSTVSTA